MCYLLYAILILLFTLYSHDTLEQLALSVRASDGQWMTIAIGWEIAPQLWPLLLLAAIAASLVTFFATRHWLGRAKSTDT
jgi:hypothetical protein